MRNLYLSIAADCWKKIPLVSAGKKACLTPRNVPSLRGARHSQRLVNGGHLPFWELGSGSQVRDGVAELLRTMP